MTSEELANIRKRNDSTWIAMNDVIRLTEEVERLNRLVGNAAAMEDLLHEVDAGLVFIDAVMPHGENPRVDAARQKAKELRRMVLALIDPEMLQHQAKEDP